ncbi:MAG: hypothetical protein EOP83_15890 [Verrucomicrobiaceae bacterium]|nr:MAG: hypothetical protein EOP83_15890 [Verrucomicrobiaceae bacterium]
MRLWEILNEEGRIVQGVNTTVDVKVGETKRQAKKFGFETTPEGIPVKIYTEVPASELINKPKPD